MSDNQFAKATNVVELIFQVVGAGTRPTNWMSERNVNKDDPLSYAEPLPATRDTLGRECIFNEVAATKIAEDALDRLRELTGNPGLPPVTFS